MIDLHNKELARLREGQEKLLRRLNDLERFVCKIDGFIDVVRGLTSQQNDLYKGRKPRQVNNGVRYMIFSRDNTAVRLTIKQNQPLNEVVQFYSVTSALAFKYVIDIHYTFKTEENIT